MFTELVEPRFGDADGLGHINNTILPQWFELARNPIFRIFNPNFEFGKWNLILVHLDVDFVGQMYINKNVEIKTWVSHIGNSSFEISQEAWQNNKTCVKGKTVIVYFNFQTQKPEPIPNCYREQLAKHLIEK